MAGRGIAHRAAGDGHRHLTGVLLEDAGEVVHVAAVGIDDGAAGIHDFVMDVCAGRLFLDGTHRGHRAGTIDVVPNVAARHLQLGIAIDGTGRQTVHIRTSLLIEVHTASAGIDVAAEHGLHGHTVVVETDLVGQQFGADGAAGYLDIAVVLDVTVGTAAEDGALDVGTRLDIDLGVVHVGHLHDVAVGRGSQTAAAAIDEAAVEALLAGVGGVADDAALDVYLGLAGFVAVGHFAGAGVHGLVAHGGQ